VLLLTSHQPWVLLQLGDLHQRGGQREDLVALRHGSGLQVPETILLVRLERKLASGQVHGLFRSYELELQVESLGSDERPIVLGCWHQLLWQVDQPIMCIQLLLQRGIIHQFICHIRLVSQWPFLAAKFLKDFLGKLFFLFYHFFKFKHYQSFADLIAIIA
jgi:hypothetical protein